MSTSCLRCSSAQGDPMNAPVPLHAVLPEQVDYRTHPDQYRHWALSVDGPVATLKADFDENAGLRPGYKLKLNSYDLGVDIELQRRASSASVSSTPPCAPWWSPAPRTRCSAPAPTSSCSASRSHAWKVNFCKFTNETRNGLEDTQQAQRPEVPGRASTAPAPAAATSWRWPAMKSSWWTTAAARSACPKCRCSACCPAPAA